MLSSRYTSLFIVTLSVLLVFFGGFYASLFGVLLISGVALFVDKSIFYLLAKHKKMWLFLPPVISLGIFIGYRGDVYLSADFTAYFFTRLITTLCRVYTLFIIGLILTKKLDAKTALAFFYRFGLERMALITSTALNLLPHLTNMLSDGYYSFSKRLGSTSVFNLVKNIPVWAVVTVTDLLLLSEDLIKSIVLTKPIKAGSLPYFSLKTPEKVCFITGKKNSGKSEVLTRLFEESKKSGASVSGFLQKSSFNEQSGKKSYNLISLKSGNEISYATTDTKGDCSFSDDFEDFVNKESNTIDENDIVILDEFGKLESGGEGIFPAVNAQLARKNPKIVFIVSRHKTLSFAIRALGSPQAEVIDIKNKNCFNKIQNMALSSDCEI